MRAEQHFATPELYVTPWFLTLFSSKVQLPVLFVLWDGYLLEGDKVFFCYLSLAILITNRGVLLRTEISQLPETLSKLSIDSTSELTSVRRFLVLLQRVSCSLCCDSWFSGGGGCRCGCCYVYLVSRSAAKAGEGKCNCREAAASIKKKNLQPVLLLLLMQEQHSKNCTRRLQIVAVVSFSSFVLRRDLWMP